MVTKILPISPKYVASTANSPIELGTGSVELRAGSATILCMGKARLELTDKERVIVEVETTVNGYKIKDHSNLQMKFGPRGQFIPVITVKS